MKKNTTFKIIFKTLGFFTFFSMLTLFAQSQNQFFGADMTYEHIENNKYEITLTYYVECNAIPFTTPKKLEVRCMKNNDPGINIKHLVTNKTVKPIKQYCEDIDDICNEPDLQGLEEHQFVFEIDFDDIALSDFLTCNQVRIAAEECCRDSGLTTGGASEGIYTYAEMNLNTVKNNSSPKFKGLSNFTICCNRGHYESFAAIDSKDGDSLSYHFTNPYKDEYRAIILQDNDLSYDYPLNVYYPGSLTRPSVFPYGVGSNPTPIGLYFDNQGSMIFAPTECEQSSPISVEIREWRKVTQTLSGGIEKTTTIHIGTIRREHHFRTTKCDNYLPEINGATVYQVMENDSFCTTFESSVKRYSNPVTGQLGPILNVQLNWDEGLPDGQWTIIDSSKTHPTAKFCWTAPIESAREEPYEFKISAMSNSCPFPSKTERLVSIKVNSTANIVNIKSEFVKIYPNPGNNQLNIESDYPNKINGLIINTRGQEVLQFDLVGKTSLDISNLPSGVYFVNLNNTVYQKFVKL
jgi:hypothetical protein